MSSICKRFNEFIQSHQDANLLELVDLTPLAEEFNNQTPVELKMSSDTSTREMARVILINMYKYTPNKKFPLLGLRAIDKIIRKDVAIEDVVLQQILLIHLTKMQADVHSLAKLMAMLDFMTVDIRMDSRFEEFHLISNLTLQNTHVRNLIDDAITETFGTHLAGKVFETKHNNVQVEFFDFEVTDLRGFSGFNSVYINKTHFDGKVDKPDYPMDLVLLDISTVTIHELAHVRIRQVLDDFNTSSPILTSGLPVEDPEFGRIVERKIFSVVVDWIYSFKIGVLPEIYVSNFLKAIRLNEKVPSVPEGACLLDRPNRVTFYGSTGVDISLGEVIE